MTETLLNIWYVMVDFVSFLFGVGLKTASWILISFFLLIIILLILVFLFKKFNKKILSFKKKLIFEYDNIFYLLASAQYKKEIDKTSMGGDPCIAAIKPILKKKNPSYIKYKDLLKDNINKVEKLLGSKVVDNLIWDKINKLYKKMKINNIFSNIFSVLLLFIIIGVLFFVLYTKIF